MDHLEKTDAQFAMELYENVKELHRKNQLLQIEIEKLKERLEQLENKVVIDL